ELASRHTHRPVALASSILKVWDTSRRHRSLSAACAAVGYHRGRMALSMMTPPLPAVASGPAVSHPLPAGQAARAITVRVERLISDGPIMTVLRRRVELALALLVLCAASSAAITVPSWIASAFTPQVYFVARPAAQPVEAPAFATFRELAPAVPASSERSSSTATTSSTANESLGCPCIESQAQLRQGIQATAPQQFSAMQWVRGEQTQRWPVGEPAGAKQSPRQLQQVLGGSSSQIGLFIVTTPAS
ncbi:MAG TPA: hypothetical protein VML96_10575, partial [Egibacteraceae bacterium]|nr:hypothetical protein [Egibacteraceae bacterium]